MSRYPLCTPLVLDGSTWLRHTMAAPSNRTGSGALCQDHARVSNHLSPYALEIGDCMRRGIDTAYPMVAKAPPR